MGCKPSTHTYPKGGPIIQVRRESTHRSLTPLIPPPGRTPTPPPGQPTPPPYQLTPTPPPDEDENEPQPTPPPYELTPTPSPDPNENEQKPVGVKGAYTRNDLGVYECTPYDFRRNPEEMDLVFSNPPTEKPYVDISFGVEVAFRNPPEPSQWRRPPEFRDAPVLFSQGVTRYDVNQGCFGTCWFLSILATLAENPKYFNKIVSDDAWNREGGYFCCQFWRFGQWERIYIDDFLPVVRDTELWGVKSKADLNEMWPSLLEKAFARFHGSYNEVTGGSPSDAFLALTGGCSEQISDIEKYLAADKGRSKMDKTLAFHRRLKNIFQAGESLVNATVPGKYSGTCGLVGNHAYSVTNAVTVSSNGQTVHLVRVRNPWGGGEWTGPWSDGSAEWNTIDQNSVPHANKDNGEFWMTLEDFTKYYTSVAICSIMPDYDRDGFSGNLDHCTSIYGEWFGKTASGAQDKVNNPRYMIEIGEEGMHEDGTVPIVLQLCQKLKHNKSKQLAIKIFLYKTKVRRGKRRLFQLPEENRTYLYSRQVTARYKVEPGIYAVVPSTFKAGGEKEFLIRIYTPGPIFNVRDHWK